MLIMSSQGSSAPGSAQVTDPLPGALSCSARCSTSTMERSAPTRGVGEKEATVKGMRRFIGHRVLVSTCDGGAVQGVLWRATADGIELRKAREVVRDVSLDGIVWVPSAQVLQVQVGEGS